MFTLCVCLVDILVSSEDDEDDEESSSEEAKLLGSQKELRKCGHYLLAKQPQSYDESVVRVCVGWVGRGRGLEVQFLVNGFTVNQRFHYSLTGFTLTMTNSG